MKKLQSNTKEEDVDISHRLGKHTNTNRGTRPIIVKNISILESLTKEIVIQLKKAKENLWFRYWTAE